MPRLRQPVISNASSTVPDDPLDEKAWDYLNKISTKKLIYLFLKKEEGQALVEQGVIKEVSFPDAVKMLANEFKVSQLQTERFSIKRRLD